MSKELQYTECNRFCDPKSLSFSTTGELPETPSIGIIGQERAKKALQFGLGVKMKGYNIYVAGAPGTGKTTFSKAFARELAQSEPTPPDTCYIYNFKNPKCPKKLMLPAGQGNAFKEDMEEFVNRLLNELPRTFGTKDYENQKAEIVREYQNMRDAVVKELSDEAKEQGFGVKNTATGIYFMPIVNGEIINEDQFEALEQEEKDLISVNSETVQKRATEVMRQMREFEKGARKDVEGLEYGIGLFAVGHHMAPLYENYGGNPEIAAYLLAVKEDILENIEDFLAEESEEDESLQNILPWYSKKNADETFMKYQVNVLTDNSGLTGAPVIVDFNPTYTNLVGEIEYDNEYGNFSTDFMKIKPGLFHKANGGYLILQAYDLLSNIHAWETLRRVLLTGEVQIEPLREYATGIAVSGIKPEPVQTNVKVIVIGSAYYYELLYEFDEDFQKLFKIYAQFDYEMPRTAEKLMDLAAFVRFFTDRKQTPPFEGAAVAKVAEYSSRLAERQDKMTARFQKIEEILTEAAAWAKLENACIITAAHIETAIAEREYRLNMYEEKLGEMIEEGSIMIDTEGAKVGQINGLAVLDMGDYCFAKPARITATTYVGKAGIVNIEKEAEMSGSIHDKGIQVLIGFLGQTYAQDFPLSLSCRICFEQNYNGIDGDSASSAELYAVLSSLANLPISQELAVTGSINQRGEIQPIGGVTYKIEGFFDLCRKRGLTGRQGVIIPRQNVTDLTLNDSVVQAVKDGLFHIYPITHVDEGIALLMGKLAGAKTDKGRWPAQTVHGVVLKKLRDFYKKSTTE